MEQNGKIKGVIFRNVKLHTLQLFTLLYNFIVLGLHNFLGFASEIMSTLGTKNCKVK